MNFKVHRAAAHGGARAGIRTLLLGGVAFGALIVATPALADGECGTGATATCAPGAYPSITYTNQAGTTLTLPSGVSVTPGGVTFSGSALTLDAQSGSTITSSTGNAVTVNGSGASLFTIGVSNASSSADVSSAINILAGAAQISLTTGSVSTSGNSSPAINVTTTSGAIDVHANQTSTTGGYVDSQSGQTADAIDAYSGSGAINIVSQTASSAGFATSAIGANSDGGGAVTINSTSASGASTEGAILAGLSMTAGGTVAITSGLISSSGRAEGIIDALASGTVTVISGTVNATSTTLAGGTTAGVPPGFGNSFPTYSAGIYAKSSAGAASITSTSFSATADRYLALYDNAATTATVNSGTIALSGAGATGISAVGGGAVNVTSQTITSTGAELAGPNNTFFAGNGIVATSSAGPITVNSGSITGAGDRFTGIAVNGGSGAVTINSGTVSTSGASAPGISVNTTSGAINIHANQTSTTGSYTFTNNQYGETADAIDAFSGSGAISITSQNASSAGPGTSAVVASSAGGGAVTINSTTASGASAQGIIVDGSSTAAGGTVNITSGVINSSGRGEAAVNGFAAGAVTVTSGTINATSGVLPAGTNLGPYTSGATAYSRGLNVSSSGGPVTVTSTAISATGDAYLAIGANATAGATTVNSGTITLSGAGASGIRAQGGGDVTVTSGTITATGQGMAGPNNAMNPGQGINAYSSGGNVTINSGDISVVATGASAISGSSAHDATLNLTGALSSPNGTTVGFGVNGTATVNVATGAVVSTGTNTANAAIVINELAPAAKTIVNIAGTITAPAAGAAVYLGAGDDTVNLTTGAKVTGYIVGGGGSNVLNMNGTINTATPTQTFGSITKFLTVNVNSGYWTATGFVDTPTVNIAAGATVDLSSVNGTFVPTNNSPSNSLSIVNNGTIRYTAGTTIGIIANSIHISGTGTSYQLGGLYLNSQAESAAQVNVVGGSNILTGDLTSAVVVGAAGQVQVGANLILDPTTNLYSIGAGGGTTGSIFGTVVADGALIFDRSNDYTLTGALSGAGTIYKNNAAAVNIIGADTFSGGFVLNGGLVRITQLLGGALQVTGPGSLLVAGGPQAASVLSGSSNIELQDSSLTVTQAATTSYSGTLSGTGSLRKSGAGALFLTGNNTYAGGTTIDGGTLVVTGALAGLTTVSPGGTLQIGALSTTGALSGDLIVNGTAVFARSDDYIFNGGVSGAGSLVKQGDGTLTLNGAYSFSGMTDVQDGNLKVTNLPSTAMVSVNSGTLDLSGTTTTVASLSGSGGQVSIDQGALTVNQTTSTDFGGSITGSGSLTVTGGGVLNLTGVSTYTGPTTVQQGLLKVNGSIASPVTVTSGGSLGGSGTIDANVTIASGGTVSPGNSPGTLHVVGDFAFNTGSTYLAQVTPQGDHDLIAATGRVTIQPGVAVTVQPFGAASDYLRASGYTIVTAAGGVAGTFSSVSSSLPLLTPSLSYTADAVNLTLVRNDIALASIAQTANGAATAAAIERGGLASPLYAGVVMLSDDQLRRAFGALSGEIYAATPTAILQSGSMLKDAALERLQGAHGGGPAIWAKVGVDSVVDPADGHAKLTSEQQGVTFGADMGWRGWTVGATVSHATQKAELPTLSNTSNIDSTYVGGFAGRRWGRFSLGLVGSYGWHDIDSRRAIAYSGVGQAATASYSADGGEILAEASYAWDVGGTTLQPFASIADADLSTDGFTETGAANGLRIGKDDRNVVFSSVGVRWAPTFRMHQTAIAPVFSVSWDAASSDLDSRINAAFLSTGQGFQITGARLPRDAVKVGVGLETELGHGFTVEGGVSGSYGDSTTNAQAHVGLAWRF